MAKDKRIDQYIENAEDFAKPILRHLRSLVHETCPEVKEGTKWGMPYFDYHGILCSMASFKNHVAFGFWKESLIPELKPYLKNNEAMGSLGRITKVTDLPSDTLMKAFILEAMRLNLEGVKVPQDKKKTIRTLNVPEYFIRALKYNKKAFATYEAFPPSQKKEYVEWVTGAKTDKTREERLVTAVHWMSEGKIRHWKYVKK